MTKSDTIYIEAMTFCYVFVILIVCMFQDLGDLRQIVHSNKSICVLSHWPFFEAFKKFLSSLYRISVSTQPIPLERQVDLMINIHVQH